MIKRKARRIIQPISQKGFGYEMPPESALVKIYFDQAGLLAESERFFKYYTKVNWCGPQGKPYRNWKVLASAWIKQLSN